MNRKILVGITGLSLVLLAGCASAERLAMIDAGYDRAIARCQRPESTCGATYRHDLEKYRQMDKDYANSPLTRLADYLGLRGGGGGTENTFVYIMN